MVGQEKVPLDEFKEFKVEDVLKPNDIRTVNNLLDSGWVVIDSKTVKTHHYQFLGENNSGRTLEYDRLVTRVILALKKK